MKSSAIDVYNISLISSIQLAVKVKYSTALNHCYIGELFIGKKDDHNDLFIYLFIIEFVERTPKCHQSVKCFGPTRTSGGRAYNAIDHTVANMTWSAMQILPTQ